MRNEIETQIIKNINDLFKNYNSLLSAKNITYDIKIKRDEYSVVEDYCSEVEINFYFNNHFFDIIEFFIFRNGSLTIDITSIITELVIDIEGLIVENRVMNQENGRIYE